MFSEKKDTSNQLRRYYNYISVLFLGVFFSSKHLAYIGEKMAGNSGK